MDVDEAKKKAATRFAVSKIGCTYNDIFSKECRDSAVRWIDCMLARFRNSRLATLEK